MWKSRASDRAELKAVEYRSGMAWNDSAPRDRAAAQILTVFGSLVTAASCILLWSTLAFGRFDDVTRLGIPVWLLAGLGIGGGLWIVWRGIAMYRADQSPRR